MKKRKLKEQNKRLRELIRHAWVHSSYKDCGHQQMTTEQKRLYRSVIGKRMKSWSSF